MSGDPHARINISSAVDPEGQAGRPQKVHNYQQPLAASRAATVGGGSKWDPVALTPWYAPTAAGTALRLLDSEHWLEISCVAQLSALCRVV